MQSVVALLAVAAPLVAAVPAGTPTATPTLAFTTHVPIPKITIAPGFTVTHTVIEGKTFPILEGGGEGGYEFTAPGGNAATGLLGISLKNDYATLPNGLVYPKLDVIVNEADTEDFIIPGILTFHDANADGNQVHCTLGLIGDSGCSGLAGIVTGEILGQPFTVSGAIEPTLHIPESTGDAFSAALTAVGSAAGFGNTAVGSVGGSFIEAATTTAIGVFASGVADGATGGLVGGI